MSTSESVTNLFTPSYHTQLSKFITHFIHSPPFNATVPIYSPGVFSEDWQMRTTGW